MALPTVEKTWYFKVNQTLPTTGNWVNDNKQLMLAIKNSLTQATGWVDRAGASVTHPYPWVVTQSSSGAGAFGNSDLWASITNVVWNYSGSNHSWVVLRPSGDLGTIGATKLELVLDCNHSEATLATVAIAWKGYAAGTATARPAASAASDNFETVLINATYWANTSYNTTFSCCLHVMMSSDGKSVRVFITKGTSTSMVMVIDEPGNAVSGVNSAGSAYWPAPCTALWISGVFNTATFTDNTNSWQYLKNTNQAYKAVGTYWSTLFYGNNSILENITVPNDLTGEYPIAPIGLVSSTSGVIGRYGNLKDLWFGMDSLPTGDMYPADGSKQFVHFNNLIVPWNGTTLVVTP